MDNSKLHNEPDGAVCPYESLLVSYLDDVGKYANRGSQVDYIRHAIRSSFAEAGKRIKFQHFGNSSYKSREMGEALRALEKALLIHLVYPQTSTVLPMLPDVSKSPRLHVLDTGMLNYFVGLLGDFSSKSQSPIKPRLPIRNTI